MTQNKILALFIASLVLIACGVNTSGNVNVTADHFQYIKDTNKNLCFAMVASRKSFTINTSGLGVAHVPCDKVGL
jgi:hypothetical protein